MEILVFLRTTEYFFVIITYIIYRYLNGCLMMYIAHIREKDKQIQTVEEQFLVRI